MPPSPPAARRPSVCLGLMRRHLGLLLLRVLDRADAAERGALRGLGRRCAARPVLLVRGRVRALVVVAGVLGVRGADARRRRLRVGRVRLVARLLHLLRLVRAATVGVAALRCVAAGREATAVRGRAHALMVGHALGKHHGSALRVGPVAAVGVDAGPHEQHEVEDHADDAEDAGHDVDGTLLPQHVLAVIGRVARGRVVRVGAAVGAPAVVVRVAGRRDQDDAGSEGEDQADEEGEPL